MSGHISDLINRVDLREAAEERVRELALELDYHGDFNPYMYVPPGPVAQAFLNDETMTSVIMGPLGGGKTTTCVFKRIIAATRAPIALHPEDGRPTRMCRWIVLRDTFRSAEKTVLESWKQWFPKTYPGSKSQGGNDRPFVHTLRFLGHDGIRVEAITEFAGLGEDNIETLMKGREYSGAWLNELDTHAVGALDDMEQRVGRYPKADIILSPRQLEDLAKTMGSKSPLISNSRQRTVIGDMNAPTVDNWTYDTLVANRGPGRAFHQQPSGLSEDAENRFNLEPGYYERIVENQEDRFVHRMVHNKFGYSQAGKPVHPSFDHARHVAKSELVLRSGKVHMGVDISTGGLSPAAMFAQPWSPGRIAMLAELYMGHGVGAARFAEGLKVVLNERFGNLAHRDLVFNPDPASQHGADREGGELAACDIISQALGVPVMIPGNGSNELSLRLGAVDAELRGYLEADTWLLISPACPLYIQGIAGRYRFRKRPQTGGSEYEDMPEKLHPWSDLQDGGQYAIIGIRGHRSIMDAIGGKAGKSERHGWSSQSNGSTGWKSGRGFDPHKVGSGRW
jgi:hypothetical protein